MQEENQTLQENEEGEEEEEGGKRLWRLQEVNHCCMGNVFNSRYACSICRGLTLGMDEGTKKRGSTTRP